MYSFLSMEAILHLLKSSGAIPKKVRIFIRLVTNTFVYVQCTQFTSFSFEMTLVIQ